MYITTGTKNTGGKTGAQLKVKEVTDGNTTTSKKLPKDVSDTSRKKGRITTAEAKNESTGGHARKRKRSSTDGGQGGRIKRAPKAEVNEGDGCGTPYRSSLGGIMTVIKELDLRDSHKRVLKLTPFWAIFEAIIDNKVTQSQCRKSDKMIIEIIESFDPDEGKFRIGKRRQLLDVTSADLGDDTDDVEDVVKLLCLYILHTFFFPMGINVKWVLFECVDDLERMRRYDWNGAIIKELMTSIKKYHKEPRKVSGCVMSLLYWLCEHTTLAQPLHPEHTLGIVRWSIPKLVNKFKKVWIKDLKQKQVCVQKTYLTLDTSYA
ncbi:hypothetical protein Vadar_023676 [Vaccinium darrowii]|uniref:Uncharacterized protein n=1 Tax=Vaccinium darrowii TaxID=229202 RepID=A0ACB7ZMI6_9ERIC|nr:hypothetical protein Vadar_023676 [Vaccinium darrowii]